MHFFHNKPLKEIQRPSLNQKRAEIKKNNLPVVRVQQIIRLNILKPKSTDISVNNRVKLKTSRN